jgi:hypothetical protein
MLYDAVWLVQSSAMPNLQQIMVSKIEPYLWQSLPKKKSILCRIGHGAKQGVARYNFGWEPNSCLL